MSERALNKLKPQKWQKNRRLASWARVPRANKKSEGRRGHAAASKTYFLSQQTEARREGRKEVKNLRAYYSWETIIRCK
jgi:hypothetical protein